MPLRIVITGCAGHVGSIVTKFALSEGHTVLGLDKPSTNDRVPSNSNFTYASCDLTDFLAYKAAIEDFDKIDGLIQIAGVFNRGGEAQWRPQERFRDDVSMKRRRAADYSKYTI